MGEAKRRGTFEERKEKAKPKPKVKVKVKENYNPDLGVFLFNNPSKLDSIKNVSITLPHKSVIHDYKDYLEVTFHSVMPTLSIDKFCITLRFKIKDREILEENSRKNILSFKIVNLSHKYTSNLGEDYIPINATVG